MLLVKRVALVVLVGFLSGILQAQTLRMNSVHRLPFQGRMLGIATGNGVSVAVGEAGSIYSSADGIAWIRRDTNVRSDLHAVAWTGSAFCAVGNDGSILTSTDGTAWVQQNSGATLNLACVTTGNGLRLMAGDAGRILTSPDGTTWTAATTSISERINGLAFGGGTFVAVSESGGILTSPDASTWTVQTSPASGALSSVAFGSGVFVAVGAAGEVLTSPDGITWTVRRSGQIERLWCVAVAGSGFTAVGSGGVVAQSSDGISWSSQAVPGSPLLHSVASGTSGLLAVSDNGSLWLSSDGSTWTSQSTGGDADLAAAATNGTGTFLAVGTGGSILHSADGASWSAAASPTTDDLEGIAFAASKFVAVGAAGRIVTSSDGMTWATVSSGTSTALKGITSGTAGFVAVGQAGIVLHSANGTAWISASIPGAKGDLLAVAFGNGLYIAVGQWGQIATSPNGVTWTLLPDDPTQKERWYDITGIAFSNGRFVTSTNYSTSFTSTDGTTWTKRTAAMVPGRDFHGAAAIGNYFVVFGDKGIIQTSSEGLAWSEVSRATGARLRGAATSGNLAVFVGDNGAIVQAASLDRQTNWTTYHDTITQVDDAAHVTTGDPTADTSLVNFSTGAAIPGVAIKFSKTVGTSGALKTDANSGNPVLGGDAAAIFGSIIGFGTQVWDLGKNTGTATITISGLSPGKIYDLAIFATRDNFSSQTKFALAGASSFSAAHSAGYLSVGGNPSGSEVTIATGDGSTVAGRVARWSDIIPSGTTLAITVTSPSPGTYSCILPQAIRLIEMTEAPVVVAAPASTTTSAGQTLTLAASVLGTGVTYQWYRRDVNGNVTAVNSATSATLNLPNISESAQYFVRATASGGSVDSSASTVIVQRTYDQWAALKGIAPSADAGDSDGDGIPNLVEYALGTNPSVQTSGPTLAIDGANRLSLTFRASKETGGVTIIPETSTTLAAGSWTSPALVQLADENFATESWMATVPLTSSSAFLRLRVTRP